MARLILDTGALVAFSRGTDVGDGDDDLAVPLIAIAEYRLGTLIDPVHQRSAQQRRFLDRLLEVVTVVEYTTAVVGHHVDLMAHTRREGRPRGAHDLLVAACARATGRILLTTDARARFDGLPGVEVRLVEP